MNELNSPKPDSSSRCVLTTLRNSAIHGGVKASGKVARAVDSITITG